MEGARQTLGQILRSDDTFNPSSWAQKVDAAVFEINISRNRMEFPHTMPCMAETPESP